jgi:HEPN domain-containing protein
MQPETVRHEETAEWLRVAAADLRLAEVAVELDPPITGLALYHAQQVAEKALKAYLVFRGQVFPFTHNLSELARASGRPRRSAACRRPAWPRPFGFRDALSLPG